jgi:hypothetical protein
LSFVGTVPTAGNGPSTPLRVLYIMGHSRSGSTILNNLLGSHQHVVAVGELANLVERGWNSICRAHAVSPAIYAHFGRRFGSIGTSLGAEKICRDMRGFSVDSKESEAFPWYYFLCTEGIRFLTSMSIIRSCCLPPLHGPPGAMWSWTHQKILCVRLHFLVHQRSV